jgi:predicted exporter
MNDDISDVEYLQLRLERTLRTARRLREDIASLDALALTATVIRLDEVREGLNDAIGVLHQIYVAAHDRDRMLDASRTVSGAQAGSGGVVADVLRAAAARVHPAGSGVPDRTVDSADVGRR